MKSAFLFFALVLSFSSFAEIEPPVRGVREGGGMPRLRESLAANFECKFKYGQQIDDKYFSVEGTRNIKTEAGRNQATVLNLEDLKLTTKDGTRKKLLKDGSVSMKLIKGTEDNKNSVYLYVTTPRIVPEGTEDIIYSNDSVYVDQTGEKTKITARASVIYAPKAGKPYSLKLDVDCSVSELKPLPMH